jgi:hypothetical protein
MALNELSGLDLLTLPPGPPRGIQDTFEPEHLAWSVPPNPSAATADFLMLAALLENTTVSAHNSAAGLVSEIAALVWVGGYPGGASQPRQRGPEGVLKLRLTTATIVGGILRAWGRGTPRPVAFDTSNEGLGELPGSRRAAAAVVAELRVAGLISFMPGVRWDLGFGFGEAAGGYRARIWPTEKLLRLASETGIAAVTVKQVFLAPSPSAVPKLAELVIVGTIRSRREKEAKPLPRVVLDAPAAATIVEVGDWIAEIKSYWIQLERFF